MTTAAGNIGSAKVVSASGNVRAYPGAVLGFLCSASTSGTIALYDDPATGTTTQLLATLSLTAGTFYPFPVAFGQGLNVVIGGTATVTMVLA